MEPNKETVEDWNNREWSTASSGRSVLLKGRWGRERNGQLGLEVIMGTCWS